GKITDEVAAREAKDTELDGKIATEAQLRETADKKLFDSISSIQEVNTQQDNRITAVEEHNLAQDQKIASNTQRIDNLEDRTKQLDKDIKKAGASAVALAALKPIQYNPLKPTQIMAGVGTFRGETATALGVAHYSNENTMFHIGASYGGSHSFAANAGVTVAVGSGADRKSLPAEYQNGPISSVYVLQNEVAQLKAENEQVKRVLMQVLQNQQTEA
ncbi:YadA C-terminal domain-containing protein, partial [Veillonella caviae]|uniref:YadA C-terminal domain-containing protein n=1 Tax=Veillonella caviae TaxID=248316 RepID=UPI002353E7EF